MADLRERLQTALGAGYRVEKELGGGGMSRVFLAEEVRLGRRVVVKVLPPEMSMGVSVDRFEREIHLAAKLQHPHIVPLLTAGSSDDLLYYIMPFIQGESLRAKLGREGELPVPEVLRVLHDVVDALAHAHSQGVVHRDIKPDNVLLAGKHALVTDFGVAKAVSDSTGAHSLTSMGVALGTPLYMAPEQAAANPNIDHRADLYAVGVLTYEMLCGRPPFTGPNPQAVLSAHVTQAPEPCTAHRPAVPGAVNALVMRCLEKHPADRWQNADELLSQLEGMMTPTGGITPTGTAPVPAVDYEARARQAHPLRVAALFGAASVAVLALVYAAVLLIGLPDWVFLGAVALLAIGLPIMVVTGHHERERALVRTTGAAVTTPGTGLKRYFTWHRALLGGGLAFAGLTVAAGGYMAMRLLGIGPVGTLVAAGVLEEGGRVILADFVDRTGDSALATTFTEAFRVDLSQSRTLRPMPAADLRGALARMQRDPTARLTAELAREVATREGVKAVVAGEINRAGGGFVLTTQLLEPESGNVIVAFRENARDSTEIITAMDRLSKQLRARAGESLKTIRAAPPLFRVTTASLPALRKYSQAQRAFFEGNTAAAVELLGEAVTLDTTFAEAYRRLAVHLSNIGTQPSARLKAMTKAYQYRDRLPETERYIVISSYLMNEAGDDHGALDALRKVLEIDSTHGIALNNSGVVYGYLRDFDRSAEFYQRGIAAYPTVALFHSNLVEVQLNRETLDRVRSALADFQRALPDHPLTRRAEILVAWTQGEYDSAEVIARALRQRYPDPGNTALALSLLTGLSAVRGRLREASQYQGGLVEFAERRGLANEALRLRTRFAHALVQLRGDAREILTPIEEMLARLPAVPADPLDPPYLDIAMLYLSAGRTDRAREWIGRYERNVPAEWRRGRAGSELEYLRTQGVLADAERRYQDAIRLFRQSDQGDCRICALPLLARAYDLAQEPDSAVALYDRYVGTLSPDRPAVDPLELPPALKRLGELHEQRGEREKAIDLYNRFLELWKDADPELQPVVREVRQRLARLVGERR